MYTKDNIAIYGSSGELTEAQEAVERFLACLRLAIIGGAVASVIGCSVAGLFVFLGTIPEWVLGVTAIPGVISFVLHITYDVEARYRRSKVSACDAEELEEAAMWGSSISEATTILSAIKAQGRGPTGMEARQINTAMRRRHKDSQLTKAHSTFVRG